MSVAIRSTVTLLLNVDIWLKDALVPLLVIDVIDSNIIGSYRAYQVVPMFAVGTVHVSCHLEPAVRIMVDDVVGKLELLFVRNIIGIEQCIIIVCAIDVAIASRTIDIQDGLFVWFKKSSIDKLKVHLSQAFECCCHILIAFSISKLGIIAIHAYDIAHIVPRSHRVDIYSLYSVDSAVALHPVDKAHRTAVCKFKIA